MSHRLRGFVGSPGFAAVTAALAAVVRLLGSVYRGKIVAAFPLNWRSGLQWLASAFWVTLMVLA